MMLPSTQPHKAPPPQVTSAASPSHPPSRSVARLAEHLFRTSLVERTQKESRQARPGLPDRADRPPLPTPPRVDPRPPPSTGDRLLAGHGADIGSAPIVARYPSTGSHHWQHSRIASSPSSVHGAARQYLSALDGGNGARHASSSGQVHSSTSYARPSSSSPALASASPQPSKPLQEAYAATPASPAPALRPYGAPRYPNPWELTSASSLRPVDGRTPLEPGGGHLSTPFAGSSRLPASHSMPSLLRPSSSPSAAPQDRPSSSSSSATPADPSSPSPARAFLLDGAIESDPRKPPGKGQCWGIKRDGRRCTRRVNEGMASRGGTPVAAAKRKGKDVGQGTGRRAKSASPTKKTTARAGGTRDVIVISGDSDSASSSSSDEGGDVLQGRRVKSAQPSSVAARSTPFAADIDVNGQEEQDGEVYCHQHAREINRSTGFYPSAPPAHLKLHAFSQPTSSSRFISFGEYLPVVPASGAGVGDSKAMASQQRILAKMRVAMQRAPSEGDWKEETYLYVYAIRGFDAEGTRGLKVGRALNPHARLSEWRTQCQGSDPILRALFPAAASSPASSSAATTSTGFLIPGAGSAATRGVRLGRLWEHLVHLELSLVGRRHLDECADCGRVHREIFIIPCRPGSSSSSSSRSGPGLGPRTEISRGTGAGAAPAPATATEDDEALHVIEAVVRKWEGFVRRLAGQGG